MTQAVFTYGKPDAIIANLGLTPSIGQKIATIITFAGAIEHHLERALWRMSKTEPKGIRPFTDSKMISQLIDMMETEGNALDNPDSRDLIEIWCCATRSAFTIRHNIAHGVPVNLGGILSYMRNPRWEGEVRKREFGDFWADEPTLDLVVAAMASLLRLIGHLSQDEGADVVDQLATPEAISALQMAKSILGEFASQLYNPAFEKY